MDGVEQQIEEGSMNLALRDNNSNPQLCSPAPLATPCRRWGTIDRGIYCIYDATYSAMGGG